MRKTILAVAIASAAAFLGGCAGGSTLPVASQSAAHGFDILGGGPPRVHSSDVVGGGPPRTIHEMDVVGGGPPHRKLHRLDVVGGGPPARLRL